MALQPSLTELRATVQNLVAREFCSSGLCFLSNELRTSTDRNIARPRNRRNAEQAVDLLHPSHCLIPCERQKNSLHFMKPDGSLPSSQQPNSEANDSCPRPPTLFKQDMFQHILAYKQQDGKMSSVSSIKGKPKIWTGEWQVELMFELSSRMQSAQLQAVRAEPSRARRSILNGRVV